MIKLSANLSFLFNELPFEKRFNASSILGFKAVEFLFPYAYKINNIKTKMLSKIIKRSALVSNQARFFGPKPYVSTKTATKAAS